VRVLICFRKKESYVLKWLKKTEQCELNLILLGIDRIELLSMRVLRWRS